MPTRGKNIDRASGVNPPTCVSSWLHRSLNSLADIGNPPVDRWSISTKMPARSMSASITTSRRFLARSLRLISRICRTMGGRETSLTAAVFSC
eukprot:scaffold87655_cov35-Tisochrysis_lutea.AAC.6